MSQPATMPREDMIPGISTAIQGVNQTLREYAPSGGLFLITGERGTEKSLAAKIMHRLSPRGDRPLGRVRVSWKLPPEFVQHVEHCREGTLAVVLQREIPIDMQYTLVEMAAHGCYVDPISGAAIDCPDMGVMLLTSHTLDQLVGSQVGTVLPELRDILEAREIPIPALRERPEDIPALVRFAILRARETGKSKVSGADAQVLALFRHWHWPNNAEDLLLVTAQAAIAAKGELITLEDLPDEFLQQIPPDQVEAARQVRAPRPPAPRRERRTSGATAPLQFPGPEDQPIPVAREAESVSPTIHSEPTPLPVATPLPAAAAAMMPGAPGDEPLEDEALLLQRRLLVMVRRLGAQASLVNAQIANPLANLRSQDMVPKLHLGPPSEETADLRKIEHELENGLDLVLSLRRQVAVLNNRQRRSIETFRDLVHRLHNASGQSISTDPEIESEKRELGRQLESINEIIEGVLRRVSDLRAESGA